MFCEFHIPNVNLFGHDTFCRLTKYNMKASCLKNILLLFWQQTANNGFFKTNQGLNINMQYVVAIITGCNIFIFTREQEPMRAVTLNAHGGIA